MKKILLTTIALLALNVAACEKKAESTTQEAKQVQTQKNSKMQAKAVAKTKEVGMEAGSACAFATDKKNCLKSFGKTKTSQEVTKQVNKI
jgi:Flp pilus assembly protein TadB